MSKHSARRTGVETVMKKGTALAGCALVLSAACAAAQIDTSGQWRYSVTPYLWTLSIHGRVGVGPVATDANVKFYEIWDALRFAAMGDAEVRHGRLFGSADVIYASVGKTDVIAIRGDTGTLTLTLKISIIQGVGGYTIVGDNKWAVDLLGGVRLWNVHPALDVDLTRRPSNPHSIERGWPDATAGLRVRALPYKKLHVVIGGDGGGGSHGTWQAYGTVGYDVWSKVALGAAYRYLSVNYEDNLFLLDVRLRGPVFGATIHW
jgi:hypothetical protein